MTDNERTPKQQRAAERRLHRTAARAAEDLVYGLRHQQAYGGRTKSDVGPKIQAREMLDEELRDLFDEE